MRLSTGEIAVVTQVHAPDPYRPRVRVLFAKDGTRLDLPFDRNLWERARDGGDGRHGRSAGRPRGFRHRPAELPHSLMSSLVVSGLWARVESASLRVASPESRVPTPVYSLR